MKIEKRALSCLPLKSKFTALKAGGRGFESHLSSYEIEKRALRFTALFAFEVQVYCLESRRSWVRNPLEQL